MNYEIKGWMRFIRGNEGRSAVAVNHQMNHGEILKVIDAKFLGDDILIMRKSTLDKMKIVNEVTLQEFIKKHLNIVEKLLNLTGK